MNAIAMKLLVISGLAGWMLCAPISNPHLGFLDPGPRTAYAAEQNLKAGMIDPKTGKKIKYWVAPMDPKYISMEPGKSPMGMDLVPVYEEAGEEKEPASTIRIDPVTEQNMGVRYGRVARKPLAKSIRTYGNITYDETRLYTINTKFDGWIDKLYVDFEGKHVRRGQPLFTIYSPDLVSAQQDFLLAVQQMHKLPASASAIARADARRLLNASRLRLKYWDLTDNQIDAIEKR
ncbi:MAG: efflux RND transporter periplasmic adaptor subunit, partial [Desulfobacteraceae bacterium]